MALTSSSPPRTYRFRAARKDGSIVRGQIREAGREHASSALRDRGLHPLSVRPARAPSLRLRPSRRQLAVAFRALADLVAGGVPLEKALQAAADLTRGRLCEALLAARAEIHEGVTLADALTQEPGLFLPSVVGIVRAGERGSRMSEALASAADQLDQEADLRSQLLGALAYPALILVVGVVSVVVLGLVVVPRFAELIESMGAQLPASTQAIVAASDLALSWGWLALPVAAGGWWAWLAAGRRRRTALHRVLLRIPFFGRIRLALASARACQSLGATLQGGMPLIEAVAVVEQSSSDTVLRDRFRRVGARLRRGEDFGTALEQENALDRRALQLLRLGEASGRLGEMARRASEILLTETRRAIGTAVSFVEPILILVLGSGVAFMSAALLRAVYSIRPGG